MKICLLNDSFPPVIDGVANVVMNYARILTEEFGDEVVVATPKYPEASYDGYPYKVVAYPSVDTTGFIKGYRTGNPLSIKGIAPLLDFEPDIIHTHCPAASMVMARVLQKQVKVPMVFTYHTKFDVDIAKAVGEGFIKNETVKAMIGNIDAADDVWVVSEGAGENLASLGYQGDYRVVSNGVDFPRGRADQALVKEVTKDYDLPEGIPTFLFVGRIIIYKGIPLILEALNKLSQKGVEYRMIFVGKGPEREQFENQIKDWGIALESTGDDGTITRIPGKEGMSGKVIFTGPVYDRERLRAWNTRADLFIFPSVYDTNGIVVREAAACGLASVLIKGSCAAEGITHGQNGYLMEESADSLTALLENLSGELDKVHQVGENALNEIYISWSDSVRDARIRYEELINAQKSGKLQLKDEDILVEYVAKMINAGKSVYDKNNEFQAGMLDNYYEFKGDIKELRNEMSDLKKEISEFKNDLKSEIKENIEDTKNKLKESGQAFKEKIDELTK
ncbi:MAG: glycosyltransferase [Butyrivibrio sp.]|nr:glycosyltransferase [Butyrivibrio sp.]